MSAPMMNHSRRDKERDGSLGVLKPSQLTTKKLAKPSRHHRHPPPLSTKPSAQPLSNNHLLAGYFAHEYLSKGTIFGQSFDPARAQAVLGSARLHSSRRGEMEPEKEKEKEKHVRYREVADLMKTDGAHLPDIVNPTQLARFVQLG